MFVVDVSLRCLHELHEVSAAVSSSHAVEPTIELLPCRGFTIKERPSSPEPLAVSFI